MAHADEPTLQRRLGFGLLVLYGLGVTVGAGIYVLVGAVAGHAGRSAPWAFVLAALVMAFTVVSYAELAGRIPMSAGEAAYARAAFKAPWISRAIGLLTIVIGIISTSAVVLGSAGYMRELVQAPTAITVTIILLILGGISSWGILESVVAASVLTMIEVGGLLVIIVAALLFDAPASVGTDLPLTMSGMAVASMLAFFAFIGFEDLANVAEEAIEPERNLPRAMFVTLILSTLLYVSVATIAVRVATPAELASSDAPLSLVFRRVASVSPATITLIAIMATLNTILAQLTMTSRVIYGMARMGDLPARLSAVDPWAHTPVIATGATVILAWILALALPIERLAEWTSAATLIVFATVNASLIALRKGEIPAAARYFRAPQWAPWAGLLSSLALVVAFLIS